jgi:hypothetical protein
MTTLHSLALAPGRPRRATRRALAHLLRAMGRLLDGVAHHLEAERASAAARGTTETTQLEFHAEAGAPEGALYLDGELVGRLPGVTRL